MSRYKIPTFSIPVFQSSVRDNNRIKELTYPIINEHQKNGITTPPSPLPSPSSTRHSFDDNAQEYENENHVDAHAQVCDIY